MASTYFKRFRMEADLLIPRRPPVLPEGYRLVAWNEALLDAHARTKYRSFCDEIDAVVFPCLGDLEGCRRLMREIRRKPGFLAEATWLIARVVAPSQHSWCGTIQGVVDKQGTGMIQNVGVVPGHRGIGLGTLLVLQAMAGFGRAGLRKASLEVTAENTSAAQLYRRLGFRRARTVYKVVDDKARAASRGTAVSRSSDTTQSASHGEAMLSHS
ncbi:GNAT family N-acetyltransferase [bacterium]|nr:GNAT family N-acetyltransferase [bacterium]